MSLSRLGLPSGDPAAPRRRFGRRRGGAAALPAGPGGPVTVSPVPAVAAAPAGAALALRSELRPVGPHFVIAPSTAGDDELSAAVATLRPVPDSIVVVAAAPDSAAVLRDRMADLGVIARSRGAATLVLAASGLAALAPNGRRPAEVVADRAGLPVIAPDGLVEITPAGNLKVTAPDGAGEAASWWHCAPGSAPRRVRETIGATAPVEPPSTAVAVVPAGPAGHLPVESATAARRPPAVHVLRLPAGFWLTHPSAPPPGPMPGLGLAAAPPGTVVLVVGTPARPVLLPEDFAEAVVGLPVDTSRLLVSAPWAAPDELAALTGALSARLARPVSAAIGLPVLGPGGPTSRILDAHGRARWEPYLLRLAAAPGQGTAPAAWRNGGASWRTDGPGVFEAFPYWALEAVPAGLWLRPEPPHVLTPRFRRPEAARPLLIVGERDRPVEADVFEELGSLLDRLPSSGSDGFGLLVHGLLEPSTERIARFIARMHDLDWLGPEQPAGSVPGVAAVSYGIGGLPAARPTAVEAAPQSAPAAVEAAPRPVPAAAEAAPQPVPAAVAPPRAAALSGPPAGPSAFAVPTTTSGGPGLPPPVAAAPRGTDPLGTARATAGGPSAAAPTEERNPAESAPLTAPATDPVTAPVTASYAHRVDTVSEPPYERTDFARLNAADVDPQGEPTTADPHGEPDEPPDRRPLEPVGPESLDPEPVEDPRELTDELTGLEPDGGPARASAPPRARHLRPEDFPVPVAVSGTDDRDAVRTLLGEHYHRCSGRIDQVTTRLPRLRSTSKDDIKPDLAAVLLHHGDTGIPAERAELIAAARSRDPILAPFLRCLGSGLRRFPSHHGAVLLCAPPGPDPAALLAHYAVGQVVTEPAPVTGLTASAVEIPGAAVEFVIWSATGRRTSAFGSGTEELRVTFAPGTSFTVVAVLPSDDTENAEDNEHAEDPGYAAEPSGRRPARVLLREYTGAAGTDPDERDRSALTRLQSWLDRRDRLGPAERRRIEDPERFHLTPGVELLPGPEGA
ncbi:hypothetical protein [Kitasatospora sp. NPDC005751]|uniref:hypothetical protein n=1 Tax=Kitasatospora sp. NPDC005751 TaxID=3157064 RepID=UPI0033D0AF3D